MPSIALCGRDAGCFADDGDVAYVTEVREVCRLAGCPEAATSAIERGLAVETVTDDLVEVCIGFRSRRSKARQLAPFSALFEPADT